MPKVAIVDYGMGNLFSVRMACERVGLEAFVTPCPVAVASADAVILPGVGAYGDAMASLTKRDLVVAIQDAAGQSKPIMGICLGMQLLMDYSEEFGLHNGLGIIAGHVRKLKAPKVPHIGWAKAGSQWYYFNHSFVCEPLYRDHVVATATYADETFCAVVRDRNVVGYQFHPEKSAGAGLDLYREFAAKVGQEVAA